nr:RNA pseudouridine synthase 5-like isoform X3 [Physcomitrium patens]|eukprot:XP_024358498.1 RNA pseudouridine synthase 5-like isoform X3 [Physcomitrella patens]
MDHIGWIGKPWPEFNEGIQYINAFECSPSSAVPSLLDYYSAKYKESASEKGWLQRIQNGQIRVDGNVITDPGFLLRDGVTLVYQRLPWREPEVPYRLGVLYEDDHLAVMVCAIVPQVAINKPSGLQVLPGGLFQQRTVLKQLEWDNEEKEKHLQACLASVSSSDETRLWKPAPVHRLGRGTSGILLCAKSPAAKSKLAADLAAGTSVSIDRMKKGDGEIDRKITKTYRALASGIIMEDEVFADIPIGKVKYSGVAGGLNMATEIGGKPSQSKVTVLWRDIVENQTLVEVQIYTGRPHQIRIHLAALGHPLVGDPLYVAGGRPREDLNTVNAENCEDKSMDPADDGGYQRPKSVLPGDCGYLLHAWRLSFFHPVTSQFGMPCRR